jgi:hypothetical protein
LSDHRYIHFQIGNIATTRVTFRNPKRTIWESYIDNLKVNLEIILCSIRIIRDKDLAVDQLQQAIIMSCHNCIAKTTHSPRKAPWLNKMVSGLRARTRRLLNIAKRTDQWDTYKETLTCYNKEIKKVK